MLLLQEEDNYKYSKNVFMIMFKLASLFFVLLLVPIIATQSFAYFGGDMVEKNSSPLNLNILDKTSDIITINELDNDEKLKRIFQCMEV